MRLVVNATSYGDPPGGAGIRARRLFGALADHELVFLVAEDTPAEVVPPSAERVVLPVRAGQPLRRWLGLRLPAGGDLLFTDHYPAASVPTVITLHDPGRGRLRRALIRRHLRRATAVVAVSGAVRDAWGIQADVVHNGVSTPPEGLPEAGRHLLVCDPGLPHKGVEVARRAAGAVGRPLREVGRGVRWLDRSELWHELARAAVVLCPAREEGFGLVLLEAMAAGRPVVASDLPAHREVGGEEVLYAAVGEPAAWRDAIVAALGSPGERLERARARASRFTWEAAASRLEEVINRVG